MTDKIKIKINDSSINLKLNEFWYFRYYIKNITHFYNQSENKSKKILISFPGTSLRLIEGQREVQSISDQVKSYIDFFDDQII